MSKRNNEEKINIADLAPPKFQKLDDGRIVASYSQAEVNYFNDMLEEDAKAHDGAKATADLQLSETYEIKEISNTNKTKDGEPGFLDYNLIQNKKQTKTEHLRVIKYELTLNKDYLPIRDFGRLWDRSTEMQESFERKFVEMYWQMNSEIIKELFIPKQQRKLAFNPLHNDTVSIDPKDKCHVQFSVINEVTGVLDNKGRTKTYYQTRRIFPSPIFDINNPLPKSLFEGMFIQQFNPESQEISNISFSLLIHLGYKDQGVGVITKGQGVQTSVEAILNKKSIIEIDNSDHLCLLHCYVLGLAHEFRQASNKKRENLRIPDQEQIREIWQEIKERHHSILKNKNSIGSLVKKINDQILHFNEEELKQHGGIRMREFESIEKKLHCQLYMWDFSSLRSGEKFNTKPTYVSENEPQDFRLCVIRISTAEGNHVHLVEKPHCLFGAQHNRYCFDCFRSYRSSLVIHNCKKQLCTVCGENKHDRWDNVDCKQCNFTFANQTCFQTHIRRKRCQEQFKCSTCGLRIYGKQKIKSHRCYEELCQNCNQYYKATKAGLRNHECYIIPPRSKEIATSIWVWDKESCLDYQREVTKTRVRGEDIEEVEEYLDHKPNLIHLMKLTFANGENFVETVKKTAQSLKQWNAGSNTKDKYEAREKIKKEIKNLVTHVELWADPVKFKNDPNYTVDEEFLNWLLEQEESGTFVAHNGGSYDVNGLFAACNQRNVVHQHIKKDGSFVQFTISNGKKVFRFIDSLKFIQAPLSRLSKDFGLGAAEKLDFPYLLNTTDNYINRVVLQQHPDIETYGLKTKLYGNNNTESYHAFVEEHHKQSELAKANPTYEFDLNKENSWYCFWDVVVLAAVWYLFRRECLRPIDVSYDRFIYLLTEVDKKKKEFESEIIKKAWNDLRLFACATTNQMLDQVKIQDQDSPEMKTLKQRARKLIESVVLHDPTNYLTIASYSVAKAMRMDLPENTFHVVREVSLQNQSQMAFRAATYMEFKYKLYFDRHAYCEDGEFNLHVPAKNHDPASNYLLDFVDTEKKTVFEFNGCRFHPCDQCRHLFLQTKDFEHEMIKEKKKEKAILEAGYQLFVMKSCEFEQIIEKGELSSSEFQDFQLHHEKYPPMKARDGCSGGSVNARVLWMDVAKINKRKQENKEKEIEIDYSDGTSLYPSQMVYGFFPAGQPNKLINPTIEQLVYNGDQEITYLDYNYIDPIKGEVVKGCYPDFQPGKLKFGRYMVRILAPEYILDPVLKMSVLDEFTKQKKLMPIRCFTCCSSKKVRFNHVCNHSAFERSFVGVFLSCELNLAIEMGYQIIKYIHVELYEPVQGVFANYMREVFKLKLLSAGKKELLEKYGSFENLQKEALNKNGLVIWCEDEIPTEKNPAMRQTSKIQINSAYGKFAQQPIKEHQQNFNTMDLLYEYLDENEHKFSSWQVDLMGSTLSFTGEQDDAYVDDNFKINPLIAAFVTSYGRRDLYYKKLVVGIEKCLYEDTDSVVYWREKGSALPFEDSDWLGGWKREVKTGISSFFLSLGPKTKYFKEDDEVDVKTGKIKKGEEHFSFKGFRCTKDFYDKMITYGGMKKILFETTQDLLDSCYDVREISASETLERNKGKEIDGIQIFNKHKDGSITTSLNAIKTVKFTNDKAMVFIPPGFVKEEIISTTPW